MALPWIFANLPTIATTMWDDDYAAVGALTVIPCTITGTDALTLSPLANTPTVSAYANYSIFSGIAAANNTVSVTAKVGSLPALNVYKDSSTGPVALVADDIVADNALELMYDSSLNTGSGGFHLISGGVNAFSGSFLPLSGGTLTGNLNGTTANFSGSVAAVGAVSGSNLTASGTVSGVSINASGRLSGASLVAGGGTPVTSILSTTASVVFGAIVPGGSADQNVSLAGVQLGDSIALGLPSPISSGIAYNGYVSAAGVVSIRATNAATTTVTPGGATYRTTAIRF